MRRSVLTARVDGAAVPLDDAHAIPREHVLRPRFCLPLIGDNPHHERCCRLVRLVRVSVMSARAPALPSPTSIPLNNSGPPVSLRTNERIGPSAFPRLDPNTPHAVQCAGLGSNKRERLPTSLPLRARSHRGLPNPVRPSDMQEISPPRRQGIPNSTIESYAAALEREAARALIAFYQLLPCTRPPQPISRQLYIQKHKRAQSRGGLKFCMEFPSLRFGSKANRPGGS